jgi:hypothetical protein
MRGAAWTFEEMLVLRRHYRWAKTGAQFAAVAAMLPGRSKAAVKQMAYRLRNRPW